MKIGDFRTMIDELDGTEKVYEITDIKLDESGGKIVVWKKVN